MALIEELQQEVAQLKAIVSKQTQLLAQTGQRIMEMQVKDVKSKMADGPPPQDKATKDVDFDDFITNEDIVQLVGELQSQLDHLEERSIQRTFNGQLSQTKDSLAQILPLTNKDGDLPDPDIFPGTVSEYLALDPTLILLLGEFYEIVLPQVDVEAELAKGKSLEDIDAALKAKTLEERLEENINNMGEIKQALSRYLGLNI